MFLSIVLYIYYQLKESYIKILSFMLLITSCFLLDGDIVLVFRTETYISALNIESELQFFKPYLEEQAILNL